MYQKIKTGLIICILIISAFGLNAQTDSIVSTISPSTIIPNKVQGEIVISKSDLIKFLEKIAKARKDKIEFELENIYLNDLNIPYSLGGYGVNNGVSSSSTTSLQSMSRDELIREIGVLNSRLNNIAGYAGVGNTTTLITGSGYAQGGEYYPYQTTPLANGMSLVAGAGNGELRWKIDSLQQEVALLSRAEPSAENQERISLLNHEIDRKQDSLIILSPLTPEAKEIVRSYGKTQMKVFFDNDSYNISPTYFEEIERAAVVLRRNSQLAVVLKGFASTVGSPKYNYDLSMRRNEAVKRMMIDYGVFPDQISSVFYGEDDTTSASEARRVDIKFIIK